MTHIRTFGVIGGDRRLLFCADSMQQDGFQTAAAGFDLWNGSPAVRQMSVLQVIDSSDALVLPLPLSKDGLHLHSPLSSRDFDLHALFSQIPPDLPVFYGLPNEVLSGSGLLKAYCYGNREDFAVSNALPTSEGAIAAAIRETDSTLSGAEVLVAGFGRIGKILSAQLRGIGARVTVSARKTSDLAIIRENGLRACKTEEIGGEYDIIFNTVPAMIFDRDILSRLSCRSLLIDLASLPGGVEEEAAAAKGIRVLHALSLPGKTAPKSAGIIIKNTVYSIIREEGL